MLKVTVSTSDYEKTIEPVAKSLARVAEAGASCGIARVYFYPSAEGVLAASIIATYLHSLGVYPAIRPSLRPPARIECPSILVGFSQVSLKGGNVSSDILAVNSGSLAGSPPPGAVFVEADGSIAAVILLAITASGQRLDPPLALMGIAGLYAGRYVTPYGKFSGLDKIVVERLMDTVDGLSYVTTLKTYRPLSGTICDAISRTLNPYFPGLTGEPDYCKSLIEPKLGDTASKPPASLDKSELGKAVDAIMDVVESLVENVDPRHYIAGLVVSEYYPQDPREALDAVINAVEATGSYASALLSVIDIDVEYAIAEKALEDLARAASRLYQSRPRRVKGPGWLRIYVLPDDINITPTLAWRAYTLLGYIDEESLLAASRDGTLLVSPIQAEYALGEGAAKRLVETKVAKERPGEVWLELESGAGAP